MGYTNPKTITLTLPMASFAAPADATEYWAGGGGLAFAASTTGRRIYVPMACTIRKATLCTAASTTAGSGESWTMNIQVNGGTKYPIEALTIANSIRNWNNTNMNIPLVAGDYFVFNTTTPTWATNPEGLIGTGIVILEYE